ncbi:MAG: alanine racemase [Alphaproteobacteria bacterium]|nr:alanine racemase [Alphaproteobacteria bacterium]
MRPGRIDQIGYRPIVEINLDRIVGNFERLASRQPAATPAAVVKCDAYGLGLVPCSRILAIRCACNMFFVAHPEEGLALRKALDRIAPTAEIFVLNGPSERSLPAFDAGKLTPILNSLAQTRLWTAERAGVPAALHADVGINRLGVPANELEEALGAPGLNLCLLMGHLSCAGTPDNSANAIELTRFRELAKAARAPRASLVSSGGVMISEEFGFDVVRLGVGLYGVSPFDAPIPEVRPAATLTAEILQVQSLRMDAKVGYGGLFRARRPTRLATIALGYGDGLPRHAPPSDDANRAYVDVGGVACPLVGRVSMDLATIDITDAPTEVAAGDRVEVFGDKMPIESIAAACGTIGYELLTRLSPRVVRRYLVGGSPAPESLLT